MTPLTQTITACPIRQDGHNAAGVPGDCLRTAVASLLDEPILDVPHFGMADGWWEALTTYAAHRGAAVLYYPVKAGHTEPDTFDEWVALKRWVNDRMAGLVLLGGPSPRGPFGHAVVGNTNMQLVHDPHPSRAGLTHVEDVIVWMPGTAEELASTGQVLL